MLWWFEFVNHTSSERTARRIIEQTASIFCGPGRSGHLTQKSRPAQGSPAEAVKLFRANEPPFKLCCSCGVRVFRPPRLRGTGLSVKASFPFHRKGAPPVYLRVTATDASGSGAPELQITAVARPRKSKLIQRPASVSRVLSCTTGFVTPNPATTPLADRASTRSRSILIASYIQGRSMLPCAFSTGDGLAHTTT